MQPMLYICIDFGTDYDVKFNDTKSVGVRIGPMFNAVCKSLQLAGNCLQFVDSVKYLAVCILASRRAKKTGQLCLIPQLDDTPITHFVE